MMPHQINKSGTICTFFFGIYTYKIFSRPEHMDAYLDQMGEKRAGQVCFVLTETIPPVLITNHAWMMDSSDD
jgi:hypothetical protein